MCGIVGEVRRHILIDEHAFTRTRDSLAHRGPDGMGSWLDSSGRVAMGHRRLSILDLSSAGLQPIHSVSGRYTMVYNGEIYNYLELRSELKKLGHIFSSSGDSEVILAAYIEWGESCLSRFNGMFALVIYDSGDLNTPASLFFARDRSGKKPLYIARHGGELAFASELKAIPKDMRGGISLNALNFYLALGYIPAALCIADGVSKLPPAYAARYIIDSGEYRHWRWWSLPTLADSNGGNVDALLDEAEALLHDAVRLRLRSDVPVGVLLSGGLDSSLVVASAADASTKLKTFTIGFPGSRLDETDYASIVARHFNTEHHVLALPEPSLAVLDELTPLIDEPLADSSLIPSYLVSKLTVGQVKVALGGDGGDELFGGYGSYTTALSDAARFGWLPQFLIKGVALAAGQLPTGVHGRNRLYGLRGGPFQSIVWGSPYFDAPARRRILSPETIAELGDDFLAPERFRLDLFMTGCDPVDSMTRTDFGSVLPDDFLVKVDRASMAVGLEMRCPLLDYRLVELAFNRLPSDWKARGTEGRRFQKRLGKRLLPQELNIQRKQGFSIPLNEWLRVSRGGELQKIRMSLPAVINQREVDSLLAGHAKGRSNGGRLFSLMMLAHSAKNLYRDV